MANAKATNDWDHTTALRCDILNSAFGRKRPVTMADIHPMRAKAKQPARKLDKEKSAALLDKVFGV